MRLFRCTTCNQLVFFENSTCLGCSGELIFDPATLQITTTPPGQPGGKCAGGVPECNWKATTNHQQCKSCALTVTEIYPTGTVQAERWGQLENAKRRVLYSLLRLGLPIDGLRFSFPESGMTGHENGMVTIVLSEADDAERERRRVELHESFRTLIGHFRHECGHYYFSCIPANSPGLLRVRELFGNEEADYSTALQSYYRQGAPPGWINGYISAYASAHPYEDWAETWAHYLHITDALEVAWAWGVAMQPHASGRGIQEPLLTLHRSSAPLPTSAMSFSSILEAWLPISCFANSLNRSIGLQDWYPFVINPAVTKKLDLIHALIPELGRSPSPAYGVVTAA